MMFEPKVNQLADRVVALEANLKHERDRVNRLTLCVTRLQQRRETKFGARLQQTMDCVNGTWHPRSGERIVHTGTGVERDGSWSRRDAAWQALLQERPNWRPTVEQLASLHEAFNQGWTRRTWSGE